MTGTPRTPSREHDVTAGDPHGVPDDLAVVFQDYSRSLFPWMRVAANIEFPLRTLGLNKAERRTRERSRLISRGYVRGGPGASFERAS